MTHNVSKSLWLSGIHLLKKIFISEKAEKNTNPGITDFTREAVATETRVHFLHSKQEHVTLTKNMGMLVNSLLFLLLLSPECLGDTFFFCGCLQGPLTKVQLLAGL